MFFKPFKFFSYTLSALAALWVTLFFTSSVWAIEFEEAWRVAEVFKSPESVAYDAKRDVLYVSNVNGYEKNAQGFISKLSPAGEILDLTWVAGLNAPTGMAIYQDTLYVGNFDELLAIDLGTGIILARYHSSDDMPLINDVAVTSEGEVFVSASRIATVYRLEEGRLKIFAQDPEKLRDANGLSIEGNYLISAAWYLTRINLETGFIKNVETSETVNDMDGLSSDGRGGFYISPIGQPFIWHILPDGSVTKAFEGDGYTADFVYVPEMKALFGAGANNSVFKLSIVNAGAK